MTAGTLFLIPVPLADCAREAVLPPEVARLAARLDTFVVEHARTARAHLKWLGHPGPLQSVRMLELDEHSGVADVEACLAPLLEGRDVGLMSEAGCPGVADPGAALVRLAHARGVRVVPMVGPSSILLALMASGLNGQRFAFHGYLPSDRGERMRRIAELERESRGRDQTQLFIETPYRNHALFDALLAGCAPSTQLCVAVDLTAQSEGVTTRTIAQWRSSTAPGLDRRPAIFLLLAA